MKTDKVFCKRNKVITFVIASLLLFLFCSPLAFADGEEGDSGGGGGFSISGEMTWEDTGLSSVTKLLLSVIKYAGLTVAAYGAGETLMSFKDDHPEGKVRGMMLIGTGVAMTTLSSFTTGLI